MSNPYESPPTVPESLGGKEMPFSVKTLAKIWLAGWAVFVVACGSICGIESSEIYEDGYLSPWLQLVPVLGLLASALAAVLYGSSVARKCFYFATTVFLFWLTLFGGALIYFLLGFAGWQD